jgi:hypothetical protein
MDEKITIIEGPPPTFEAANEIWPRGLNESPVLSEVAVTRLRTFNGPALVERCHRAWHHQEPIHLEYRSSEGLPASAPIVAARYIETDEGQLLVLWVRLNQGETELEIGFDNTDDDADDYDGYDDGQDGDDEDDDEDDDNLNDLIDPGNPLGPDNWTL